MTVEELLQHWLADREAVVLGWFVGTGRVLMEDAVDLAVALAEDDPEQHIARGFARKLRAAIAAKHADCHPAHVAVGEGRFADAEREIARLTAEYGSQDCDVLDLNRLLRFKKFVGEKK
jgi:hypothetical protein